MQGPLDHSPKPDNQRPVACPTERPRVVGNAEGASEPEGAGRKPERLASAGPPDEPSLRVREDDGGLPFIRCLLCHCDNPVGATLCTVCAADLTTSAQRSFNGTLQDHYLREQAEYRQETDRIAAQRRKLETENARVLKDLGRLQYRQSLHPARSPWLFRIFRNR
jgi:hypothetical protein